MTEKLYDKLLSEGWRLVIMEGVGGLRLLSKKDEICVVHISLNCYKLKPTKILIEIDAVPPVGTANGPGPGSGDAC